MKRHDDGTLYERWLENRDADAFAELARRHTPVVYDLAVRASGNRVLAEDLVQEALLDLAQAGTRKPIEVGIVAWLVRFAICRARNARSSERSRTRRQRIVGERRREVDMPDEMLATHDELAHALSRAEPEERTLLAMRYLHGWDYREIAVSLSLSQGAARVRVHRALAAVRGRLGVVAGAAAPAALAALPLHAMSPGFLEHAVSRAVQSVPVPATAGGGRTAAPRGGGWRIPVLSLGLVSALSVATLVAADPAATAHLAIGDLPDVARALLTGTTIGSAAPDGSGAGRTSHAVPRPPDWDDGVLVRLGRDRATTPPAVVNEESGSAPTDPAQDDEIRAVPRGDDPSPDEVLRPMSRDARAATRGSVSSEDERAGNSAGRGKSTRRAADDTAAAGGEVEAAAAADDAADVEPVVELGEPEVPQIAFAVADDETNPGLPADLVDPDPTRTRRQAPVERKPIEELDAAQQEQIGAAVDIVRGVVAASGTDAAALESDARARRRETRQLKQQFRAWRREVAALDAASAAEGGPGVTTTRVRRSLSLRVLGLLMQVALADGQTVGELVWPDGADWTAALEEVVRVLESAQDAGLLLPDGAILDAGSADTAASDFGGGTLPDGAAVTSDLPEGAQE